MTWQSSWGYQMWTCDSCGCLAIASALTRCPMCGKEREMPKATSGGTSNRWAAQDAPEAEDSGVTASGGVSLPAPEAEQPEDDSPTAAVRAWAADQGLEVAARGKLPQLVLDAYANRDKAG